MWPHLARHIAQSADEGTYRGVQPSPGGSEYVYAKPGHRAHSLIEELFYNIKIVVLKWGVKYNTIPDLEEEHEIDDHEGLPDIWIPDSGD